MYKFSAQSAPWSARLRRVQTDEQRARKHALAHMYTHVISQQAHTSNGCNKNGTAAPQLPLSCPSAAPTAAPTAAPIFHTQHAFLEERELSSFPLKNKNARDVCENIGAAVGAAVGAAEGQLRGS